MTAIGMTACSHQPAPKAEGGETSFNYVVDQFADLQVLRYQVPGFEELSLRQKQLLYHLSEAALMGRDILADQNCRYNLPIRRTLEAVYTSYKGNREDEQFKALETYLKRVWFSNGIHHHYAEDKILPTFSQEFFADCVRQVEPAKLPLREGETVDQLLAELSPVIFDPTVLSKRTVQSGDVDLIQASANNYYEGDLTQAEVDAFYTKMKAGQDTLRPISYGLNSRLAKVDGRVFEKVWKVGGLYTQAIERIVSELQQALPFAENEAQKAIIEKLIEYYQTGDLKTFDAYSVLWVEDTASDVDFVNGFIETYGDPLGRKASWESTVNFINKRATERTRIISSNAQWFEDHSPIDPRFRKPEVKGVSAKVITVAMLGGDCYPATPIGINLTPTGFAATTVPSPLPSRISPRLTTKPRKAAASPRSSCGARRKSNSRRSMAFRPTICIRTSTNALGTAPASSSRVWTPMPWAPIAPRWRKRAPTSSDFTIWQTRRWSNSAFSLRPMPTRQLITII